MREFLKLTIIGLLLPLFYNVAEASVKASKIETPNAVVARKLAISFHHAILQTNYEDGYIIADLAESEIKGLEKLGFKITAATDWQARYQKFQQDLAIKTKTHKDKKLAGIPGFECYATVEETFEQALDFVANYPTLAEWIDIGDSWKKSNGLGGYDLMVLKITNQDIVGEKPKLFINSGLHAREYAPAALTLDFAHKLLEEYQSNADIRWIVDHHEVHLLLQTNPDGRKIAETGVNQRKNENQNHCPDNRVGVDINRNFAFFWNTTANGSSGSECSDVFRGISPESEPETQALSDYVRSIFNDRRGSLEQDAAPDDTTGMHLDIHSYSQLVLWPYGHTNNTSPNNEAYVALGNKLAWFNQYTPQQSIGLYPTDGTSDDVSYGELGVAAFTFELGNQFFEACSNYQNTIKPDNLAALVYAAKVISSPYLLAFGPEISQVELNGSLATVSIFPGENIEIKVTATSQQTQLSEASPHISRVEYSIDEPIWLEDAEVIELTDNDGELSSGVETLSGLISTDGLAIGQHQLFVRAYSDGDKVGVTSSRFIQISETINQLPIADFSYSCSDLKCDFDASQSSDPDGSITSYLWEFVEGGVGSTALTGMLASHTFSQAGTKQIHLTVTDNLGSQVVKSLEITVSAPEAVTRSSSSGGGILIWLNGFLLLLICGKYIQTNILKPICLNVRGSLNASNVT